MEFSFQECFKCFSFSLIWSKAKYKILGNCYHPFLSQGAWEGLMFRIALSASIA